MNRKARSGLVLTLLLVGMLPLAFNIELTKAEPEMWYVDDDGGADFTRIQDAIDAAAFMGDTIYVYNGIYYENLHISKSLTLMGEDRSQTIIDGGGKTVVSIFANSVGVSRFTIRNGGISPWHQYASGIYLRAAKSCRISDNIVSGSMWGITLEKASGNTVSGNTISNVTYGVPFYGPVYYNIVRDNSISDAKLAIFFNGDMPSHYNTVAGNQISNSEKGIYFNYPYHNTVAGNTIKDMVGYATYGIQLQLGGNDNIVTDNTVSDCDYGIAIRRSDRNILSGNTVFNSVYGIELREQSVENTVADNNLKGNALAITIWDSNLNTVINNNLTSNDYGIELWAPSEENMIIQNVILNHGIGITLDGGVNNVIAENTIADNDVGIWRREAYSNDIYHNSFVNNSPQVFDISWIYTEYAPSVDTWDNGYLSGGNYWSDHGTDDVYSGVNQDEPGLDGIVDEPYIIDEHNRDRYPLVHPIIHATVDFKAWNKGKWIPAYIELPEPFSASGIDVSTVKLNDTIAIGKPTGIGDYDSDGIPDLMVKFDSAEVRDWLATLDCPVRGGYYHITLTITGKLTDGKRFGGSKPYVSIFAKSK